MSEVIFKKFFWATLVGTLIASGVGIFLGYYLPEEEKVWALVAQNLINQAIDTIMLWILVKWRPKLMFSFKRLKSLLSYGWKLLVSALLDTGYNELTALVIGKKFSSSDLGYYNRGKQFPSFLVTNLNASIDGVLLPSMSAVQDDRKRVKTMTRRSIMVGSFVVMPAMVGLAAVAPSLVHVLLTDKWLPCVLFLQLSCVTYAFWPIYTANLNAMKALGRSDLFLKLEILKKLVGLSLLFSFMWISVEAVAWSALIATVFSLVINTWPNKKILGYSLFEQLKDMMPSILLSIFMGGIVFLIGYFMGNHLITLIVQISAGIAIYIGFSFLFKLQAFIYIVDTIKSFNFIKRKKSRHHTESKSNDVGILNKPIENFSDNKSSAEGKNQESESGGNEND